MYSLNNLSVQFGGEPLFDNISFIINERDRIGLVGKNGAGKSTLLKIICGRQRPDSGNAIIPEDRTVGYLPQELVSQSDKTVFEETQTAFHEVETLRSRIESLEKELADRTDYESSYYQKLLRDHHGAYERFHLFGGQSVHADIEKTLTGLGFEPVDFSRPLKQFSSGWQMRVEIAKILLSKPDLVLLDEPTNHLDIESIQWLEEVLIAYPGAVILVSHDRAFLDNITRRTVEITLGKIYDYKANYSEYVRLREERLESQIATYNNQQQQIRQIERFIERFRYKNTKSKQVQSRIKMLEKMEEVELDLIDESGIRFRFPPAPHSGKIVLEARNLSKSFPQKDVLRDLNFTVVKKDKIAFVGRNGEGKTTLSRIIARKIDHSGELKFGHQVITGYYAQDQSDFLDPEKTVFATIDEIATGDIRPKIKSILGGFLFSGDTIEKKVKVLSGGEKSRLSLAKLLLIPSNLMVLDEPTNHLDMHSKDILKNALLQYNGTLIVVSHDRDFLQGLTNKVFEFRNGSVREYPGDIYDFLEHRKLRALSQLELSKAQGGKAEKEDQASENKKTWEKRKTEEKELRKLKNQIEKCESEITILESEIGKKELVLGDPATYKDFSKYNVIFEEYNRLKKQLETEVGKWEKAHQLLEVLKRQGS